MAMIQTHMEMDRTEALQAAEGKGNPELSAHCQKLRELLKRQLDLLNQTATLEDELSAERQAIRQARVSTATPTTTAPKASR